MPLLTPEKALRDFPKTPVILAAILHGVDQARARRATDGPDGWSVLEIVGHVADLEGVFFERTRQIAENDLPHLIAVDQEALAQSQRYNDQPLTEMLARYFSQRRAHFAYAQTLTPEQWQRKGIHTASGEITLLENVINTTLHDVNHIEQVLKALGSAAPLAAL